MTKYDKEFQSNTPEFEEARKPFEEEAHEHPHPRGNEDREPPQKREDDEK